MKITVDKSKVYKKGFHKVVFFFNPQTIKRKTLYHSNICKYPKMDKLLLKRLN